MEGAGRAGANGLPDGVHVHVDVSRPPGGRSLDRARSDGRAVIGPAALVLRLRACPSDTRQLHSTNGEDEAG
jgi:hypothetical protein